MNVAPINSALSAVQNINTTQSIAGQFSMKMLDNALDMSEAENQGIFKMMEMSVNPNVGGNFDVRA